MRIVLPVLAFSTLLLLLSTLSGCAGTDNSAQNRTSIGVSRIQSCRVSDTAINTSASCLSGNAACYQLSDGSWCTGERGNVCPAGSTALTAGFACPKGARCVAVSESLTCAIQTTTN